MVLTPVKMQNLRYLIRKTKPNYILPIQDYNLETHFKYRHTWKRICHANPSQKKAEMAI